ncbi:ABC transporter substrate-binding protein [Camelimonas fluminis]|uniref:ABC transporter substrate-binding protein n=1 Tax=Camelimonas fluminis TaxID=1576911 RepID=A0ABV7UDW3_9HYPH|nr:ABC transporter substrate-binding protein [Camelimonas fluminis]GHE66438.1 ABC transporter substrate-binding protein [Camelimonas fluminis]
MRSFRDYCRYSGVLPAVFFAAAAASSPVLAETITIGIGTQNTTTNTATGGVVLKELGLLEKHLPKTGKYKDVSYRFNWQNFTSGPPITNGMMADTIQIGMMGDYPLLVNGATGQASGNETQLVAVIAYNPVGGGNGVVVHKDSPYFELGDLKGKAVSVPFGSAAHGMMLQALQARGAPASFWKLVSQSPEVGATNLQEKRIDGHGDFVPFAELLPRRGFARKIFDGAETGVPTFHGVVVRKDFGEKYPEIVVAYIKALMEANDWVRANPKDAAQKIEDWTRIDKEVVYVFLGPGGVHTLDPTIKPLEVDALRTGYGVLDNLKMIKPMDIGKWVNDSFVRKAFAERGLDYEKQKASLAGYQVGGHDPVCDRPVTDAKKAGEIWIAGGDIIPLSSPECTLKGVKTFEAEGKKAAAVYVVDNALGIKVFADAAFYALTGASGQQSVTPFLLKKDAEAFAAKHNGKLATWSEALAASP